MSNIDMIREVATARKKTLPSAKSWLADRIARSKDGPIVDVVDLTVDLARELLRNNDGNRRVSESMVEKYTRDIVAGHWSFNGQTIVVSRDGPMNDGQHRCFAVIAANKSIKTAIAFGMDRPSRLTLDQGRARRMSDYLDMLGYHDTTNLACAAQYVWQYENHGVISPKMGSRATKKEVMEIVDTRPAIIDAMKAISTKKCGTLGNRGLFVFCRYIFAMKSRPDDADIFMEKLLGGASLEDGDPILYVRNRLIAGHRSGTIRAQAKAELIVRAWNASRRGDKVKTLPVHGDVLPKIEA